MRVALRFTAAALLPLTLAACPGGVTTKGAGGGPVSGAAGGGASLDAASDLERCDQPLGTLAFDDGRERYWYGDFSRRTGVTRIEPLLRLHAQQTNCFVITSLGNQRLENRIQAITEIGRASCRERVCHRV